MGNYTYEWTKNGTIINGNNKFQTNLFIGSYQVKITDGYNMTAFSNVIRVWTHEFDWIEIPSGDYSFGTPLALDTLTM